MFSQFETKSMHMKWSFALVVCLFLLPGEHRLGSTQLTADDAVDTLVEQLTSGDDRQKIRAANALAEKGPLAEAAVDALIEALQSNNNELSVAAAYALGSIGPKAEAAIPILIDRMGLVRFLNEQPISREYANVVAQIGEKAVPALAEELDTRNYEQLRGVCEALHQLGPASAPAMDGLIKLVRSENDEVAWAGMYVMKAIGEGAAPGLEAVMPMLDREDFQLQLLGIQVIVAIGPEAKPAAPQLLRLLDEGALSIRSNAAMALGAIGPLEDVDLVEKLLPHTTSFFDPMRERSLIALSYLGPDAKSALPKLRELGADANYSNRAYVATAIWKITEKPDEAIEILVSLIDHLDFGLPALRALGEMGAEGEGAVPAIVEILEHEDPALRFEAVAALGNIGPAAASAKEQVRKLLRDNDRDIAAAARVALAKIEAME